MKTIILTGAGSGIGKAIAKKFANDDFKIVLIGRNKTNLENTQQELKNPDTHKIIAASTTDAQALKTNFADCDLSNLYAVIANAGIGGENIYGPEDRWNEIINTNLTGPYVLANEALPYLKKSASPYRHIILVSSVLAKLGVPGYSAYCSSKAGLLGLTRSLSVELARKNILVNAICPGWVETDMANQGLQIMADQTGKSFEEIKAEQMSFTPIHKMSTPEEIADLCAYLLGENQTSITGQSIDINNGSIMN